MTPDEFIRDGGVIQRGGATVMSRETYLASIGYAPDRKPLTIVALFDQGKWWRQKSGEWALIADMSPGHRYNSAAMLMRAAAVHAHRYAFGFGVVVGAHDGGEMAHNALEDIEQDLWSQSRSDPRGWLRSTNLYQALTADLIIQGDGTEPWQKTGRDPVTGEPTEVPPPMVKVCKIPDCGCTGEVHA